MVQAPMGNLKETIEQIQIERQRLAQVEKHFVAVIGYYEEPGRAADVAVADLPDRARSGSRRSSPEPRLQ